MIPRLLDGFLERVFSSTEKFCFFDLRERWDNNITSTVQNLVLIEIFRPQVHIFETSPARLGSGTTSLARLAAWLYGLTRQFYWNLFSSSRAELASSFSRRVLSSEIISDTRYAAES